MSNLKLVSLQGSSGHTLKQLCGPFLRDDALGRQSQDVEPSIAHQSEVGGGGYCYARVEEGGVLHGLAIESLGAVFEHSRWGFIGQYLYSLETTSRYP